MHSLARFILISCIFLPTLASAKPLHIFVSVLPLQTFVEKIGGEHVEVQTLVRPGHNPATYSPTPQQISALAQADLYIRTGVPFEQAWMPRIQATNKTMPILDARKGIQLRQLEAHHDGHHDGQDPHIWTSPKAAKHIARNIQQQLGQLDPNNKQNYQQNYTSFAQQLDELNQQIQTLLAPVSQRKFMVFHPSWGYFADAYQLQQIAIEHEGKQPGAHALSQLIEQAKQNQIKVVFVQPQFDQRQAEQIARAIDGKVMAVDPLAANYLDNLRQVAQQFSQALQP
jgi:zinc transport system substrate-binding protein